MINTGRENVLMANSLGSKPVALVSFTLYGIKWLLAKVYGLLNQMSYEDWML